MINNNRIVFSIKEGYAMLKPNEILLAEGKSNYSVIHTLGCEEYLISSSLKQVEEMLPSETFFRVHKSHLVNMNHIKTINRKDAMVTMIDGRKLPIALRRLKKFLENICN